MRIKSFFAAAALCLGAGCVSAPEEAVPDAGAAPPEGTDVPTAYSISPYLYGWAIAVGDFNGDGTDDIAIGAPNKTVSGHVDAGAVYIYTTGPAGLAYAQTLTAADAGYSIASSNKFGYALAARDMDGDRKAELVVGCPECLVGTAQAGTVFVYRGGATLTSNGQTINQGMFSGESPEAGDKFGEEVAIGFFGGAGHPSIAVGVPEEKTVNNTVKSGWVDIFNVGANLIATPSQGFNDSAFGPVGQNDFGYQLAVLDMDDDGKDELVVGATGISEFLDVFKGSPLAPWQHIANGHGWGIGLGVGYFHGRFFPSGHRMPELAATTTHDNLSYIAMLKPTLLGGNYSLVSTGEITDPGAHAANFADTFGAGHLIAGDFDHDGSDELVVPALDGEDGANGHYYAFKSTNGGAMTYWNDRAMPSPPACNGTCSYGHAIGVGLFHNPVGSPHGADLDMIVGAPYANLADFYFGDGDGSLPTYDHTMTNP